MNVFIHDIRSVDDLLDKIKDIRTFNNITIRLPNPFGCINIVDNKLGFIRTIFEAFPLRGTGIRTCGNNAYTRPNYEDPGNEAAFNALKYAIRNKYILFDGRRYILNTTSYGTIEDGIIWLPNGELLADDNRLLFSCGAINLWLFLRAMFPDGVLPDDPTCEGPLCRPVKSRGWLQSMAEMSGYGTPVNPLPMPTPPNPRREAKLSKISSAPESWPSLYGSAVGDASLGGKSRKRRSKGKKSKRFPINKKKGTKRRR